MIEITITVDGIKYDVTFDGDDVSKITTYEGTEDIRGTLNYVYVCRLERIAKEQLLREYGSEWDLTGNAEAVRREHWEEAAERKADQVRDDAMTEGKKI